ncbi:hypothetical protein, partial [Bifidobacterium magnum]
MVDVNFSENPEKQTSASLIKKIDISETILKACQVPGVKINRASFLRGAFRNHFDEETIERAIESTPAKAGIHVDELDPIAKGAINYEALKTISLSAAAGIPGGLAMIGTVPGDVLQYFAHVLRIVQKLAYLYGWPDFFELNEDRIEFNEDKIDDATKNEIILFLGVMFSTVGAENGLAKVAEMLAKNAAKKLPQQALTKGVVYPIVKKVAGMLGKQMTKQIFARSVSKAIPLIGAAVSGGMTAATYTPMSYKLKNYLAELKIATQVDES